MRYLIVSILVLIGAADAHADPFFLRYDANEFPEQVGWERFANDPHGLLIRTIENGIFTIDSRASPEISDFYRRHVEELQLQPGEEFRLEWCMQTLETGTVWLDTDVKVLVSNSGAQFVQMFLAPDYVAVNEDGVEWPEHVYQFDPEQPHVFLFTSTNMEEYDLFVDGVFAFHGRFTRNYVAGPNRLSFGDTYYGLSSLSQWDYLQIEVVPEAGSGSLAVVTMAVFVTAVLRRSR